MLLRNVDLSWTRSSTVFTYPTVRREETALGRAAAENRRSTLAAAVASPSALASASTWPGRASASVRTVTGKLGTRPLQEPR